MKEIDQIWADLQSELTALDKEKNAIRRLELSRKAAKEAVERLEDFFASREGFMGDPLALGTFNRDLAPPFYARFIFFSKVSAFEYLKVDADPGEWEQLYEVELACIKHFFQQQAVFRRYYLSGATDHDSLYFQNVSHNTIRLDELVVGISPDVNKGCLLVGYIQALEEFRSCLTTTRQSVEAEPVIDPDLKWTGSPSDLNDLLIVLEGRIYKGSRPATLKELRRDFGRFLHVNLGNGSQLDSKRRNRLIDAPGFLEELAETARKRKDELAANQKSRKRRG